MRTALVYLAHLQTLSTTLQAGPFGRIGLLPIWSNLSTSGTDSLYAQLFLDPGVLQNDPVFDDPTGNYLSSGSALVKDHLLSLQGALQLTSNDIGLILTDAGLDPNTAPLSLVNVSLLYRCSLLAAGLQLSVADFIGLKGLSGLNPFAALGAKPIASVAEDLPLTQTIELVEQAGKVQASGFSVADLSYLLRHKFDPVGKYSPNQGGLMQLVKSISDSMHAIQSENAIPSEPLTFTDAVIRSKLRLMFPSSVVQTFMEMWTGTKRYRASHPDVSAANQLPDLSKNFPAVQVSYDPQKNVQELTYAGVLSAAQKTQITAANNSPVLAALLDDVDQEARAFFENFVSPPGQHAIGFLPAADFETLFVLPAPGVSDAPRRKTLAEKFLPYLQANLIRQAAVQALVSGSGASPSLVQALITDDRRLSDPSQPDANLLEAFAAAAKIGVDVSHFSSVDGSGAAVAPPGIAVTVDNTGDAGIGLGKPAGAHSAHFEGYCEVAANGTYGFFAQLDKQNAQVTLKFDFLAKPLLLAAAPTDGAEIPPGFVELKRGIPYHFTLDAHNLGDGGVRLLVQGESLPKGSLDQLKLYPQSAVHRFDRARVLLAKTLQIIQGFNFTEREVIYLLGNAGDFDNLSFSDLPTRPDDDAPAKGARLLKQFLRLADYSTLKQGPAGGADGLIDIFERARQNLLAGADPSQSTEPFLAALYQKVADLTRRDVITVKQTAEQLRFAMQSDSTGGQLRLTAPDFCNEKGLGRLWKALQLVQTVGIPVESLAAVTGIITKKEANERYVVAGNLRNAVKAYYTPDAWRPIAQSIFDPLRQRKRDALCSFLVNRLLLENTEQLFEFFLVDPGMEPVVTTSRLRLALSSVQTFIQRCFLNLEAQVPPLALDADQWEWMKRYRVWQANREIFLWPENWMIPEFRLDKTDLFQQLESALLQGDITNDAVEKALFDYLSALEERARLDIVSMYPDEDSRQSADGTPGDPGGGSDTLHVIGRNYGKPQKFFYRRFADGMWTAWEPITVDIEGDHVAAVIWCDRLHVFWLTFAPLNQPPKAQNGANKDTGKQLVQMYYSDLAQNVGAAKAQNKVKIQLNWCDYSQGKWSKRKSTDLNRARYYDVWDDFDPLDAFIWVTNKGDGAIYINCSCTGFFNAHFRLVSKNGEPAESPPESNQIDFETPQPGLAYSGGVQLGTKYGESGQLFSLMIREIVSQNGIIQQSSGGSQKILKQSTNFTLLICDNALRVTSLPSTDPYLEEAAAASGPFFYEDLDSGTTLFVEPSLTERTINQFDGWAIPSLHPDVVDAGSDFSNKVPLVAHVPSIGPVHPSDPTAIYKIQPNVDWATDPATAIALGTRVIGQNGAIDRSVLTAEQGNSANLERVVTSSGLDLAKFGALKATETVG
jgi:hypothetical protein